MATEFNKLYLNVGRRPSPKYLMVALPMNLYRVETNEFTHGLNFFQTIVLKLKAKPGIKEEQIADYLGLDPKLISIVSSELQGKGFINEHGSLSELGKEKLWEVDGLVIDSGRKKLGYVLQHINEDRFYQYYVNKLTPADTIENSKNSYLQVVTGTKGDGEDYTELPYFLDNLLKERVVLPGPTERDVLRLIKNSNTKVSVLTDEMVNNEKLSSQLSIRFLSEQPELIWVCTYIYLHQRDDETFEPEWRVLDPFGFGDNTTLKFYLNSPSNKNLLESISKRFSDARTINGKILSDYQEQIHQLVEDCISDFSFGFHQLDSNLQQYIQAIVKSYILQQQYDYSDLDASASFSLNLQNALENLLKQDRAKRSELYKLVYKELDNDSQKKRNALIDIYKSRLFSRNTLVPQTLLNASRQTLSRGNSLLSYLVAFILTYNYDYKSPLFKILKDKVETIIEVAQLRNEKGHGQTAQEKRLVALSKEEVEKYYQFLKLLINDFIQSQ